MITVNSLCSNHIIVCTFVPCNVLSLQVVSLFHRVKKDLALTDVKVLYNLQFCEQRGEK